MDNQIAPEKAAQREGARKNDGKFGTQVHGEPPVSLGGTPARPQWLNGWPESFPEPELSYEIGDNSSVSTFASINGDVVFEAWSPNDNITPVQTEGYTDIEFDGSDDPDAREAASEWVRKQHMAIAGQVRKEMKAAAQRIHHGVIAGITGTAAPVSNEELDAIILSNSAVLHQAGKDMELAATARLARGALEEHPTAAAIVLDTAEVDDSGEIVTGFVVVDADGTQLAQYDPHSTAGWASYAANLPAANGWWEIYTPKTHQSAYTVGLAAAAAWAPGQS